MRCPTIDFGELAGTGILSETGLARAAQEPSLPGGAPGAIQFDPTPPGLTRALAGLAMGGAAHVVLRLRDCSGKLSEREEEDNEERRENDLSSIHPGPQSRALNRAAAEAFIAATPPAPPP